MYINIYQNTENKRQRKKLIFKGVLTDAKQQQMKSVVKNKLLMLNSFSASILELKRMKAKHRVLALQLNHLGILKKGPKASQTAMVRKQSSWEDQ